MERASEENSSLAVRALWLHYKGLKIEPTPSWHHADNAAYKTSPPPPLEDLYENSGYMVAY